MTGGLLSIEGIQVLCTYETNGAKYYCNSILPCSADIQHVGAEGKEFAEKLIYQHGILDTGGEFIKWVPEEMISMVIRGFGLKEQANEKGYHHPPSNGWCTVIKTYNACHLWI